MSKEDKNNNIISVEIKLTKKVEPIQDDFIKWDPVPGKNKIFIPTNITFNSNTGLKDAMIDPNNKNNLSSSQLIFNRKVYDYIIKNNKNTKNLSTTMLGNNKYLNPFIIEEAKKIFTEKDQVIKFMTSISNKSEIKDSDYAPKSIQIIDVANFIIKCYFIVPNNQIPIIINSEKYLVDTVKEYHPNISESFELLNALSCFTKLHCCESSDIDINFNSESFICKKSSKKKVCDDIPSLSELQDNINKLETLNKKSKANSAEIKEIKNKFKFIDIPNIYYPSEKFDNYDKTLDKLITGLLNKSLNQKDGKHNGCVLKIKDTSSNELIKKAVAQKWIDKEKELDDLAKKTKTKDFGQKKQAFIEYQNWLKNKNTDYWCYIINYINNLKLKEGYLVCEYTLAISINKTISKKSLANIKQDCKSGKAKLELQKSCDALCETAEKSDKTKTPDNESVDDKTETVDNESIVDEGNMAADFKCLFCKVVMDCGFGADKDLVIKDVHGKIIKNKPSKLDTSPLDVKSSKNFCGENFVGQENGNVVSEKQLNCKKN